MTDSAADLLSGYHLALLRPVKDMLGAYLALTLQSRAVAYQFHVRANGVTRFGLTHTGIQSVQLPLPAPPRAACHRPLPGLRGPAHPAVCQRQAEAHPAVGGGEAGRRQPSRHPRPRPQRPPQALRRRVARRCACALGFAEAPYRCRYARQQCGQAHEGGRIPRSSLQLRRCLQRNDHITPIMPFMAATATSSEIERFRLRRGDVLITKDSETWDDIAVPAFVAESADDLLSGYHLALLRPSDKLLGAYLARTLQTRAVSYQFHIRANGVTRYGLTHTGIQSVRIPFPPLAEQAAIVEHLGQAMAGIDAQMATRPSPSRVGGGVPHAANRRRGDRQVGCA